MAQEGDLICTFLSLYLHPADTYFPFMHNDTISLFGLYCDTVPHPPPHPTPTASIHTVTCITIRNIPKMDFYDISPNIGQVTLVLPSRLSVQDLVVTQTLNLFHPLTMSR